MSPLSSLVHTVKTDSLGAVFCFLSLTFPIVALWNPKALVPLLAVGALWAAIVLIRGRAAFSPWRKSVLLSTAMAAFFVLALVMAPWSNDPETAYVSVLKLGGSILIFAVMAAAAVRLTDSGLRAAMSCLLISCLIVAGFMSIDILTKGTLSRIFLQFTLVDHYGFFWFKFASTVLIISMLICGFFLVKSGRLTLAIVLLLASGLIAAGIGNRTAAVGCIGAVILGCVYHLAGRWRHRLLSLFLIIVFTSPLFILPAGFSGDRVGKMFGGPTSVAGSVIYRMHIWEFVLHRIEERPLLGWSIGSSKQFGDDTLITLHDANIGDLGEPVPSHPHNAVLQIWLEMGAAGAVLALMILVCGTYALDLRARSPADHIWGFGILFLLACFFGFSYSVFSSAWLSVATYTLAMVLALMRYPVRQDAA